MQQEKLQVQIMRLFAGLSITKCKIPRDNIHSCRKFKSYKRVVIIQTQKPIRLQTTVSTTLVKIALPVRTLAITLSLTEDLTKPHRSSKTIPSLRISHMDRTRPAASIIISWVRQIVHLASNKIRIDLELVSNKHKDSKRCKVQQVSSLVRRNSIHSVNQTTIRFNRVRALHLEIIRLSKTNPSRLVLGKDKLNSRQTSLSQLVVILQEILATILATMQQQEIAFSINHKLRRFRHQTFSSQTKISKHQHHLSLEISNSSQNSHSSLDRVNHFSLSRTINSSRFKSLTFLEQATLIKLHRVSLLHHNRLQACPSKIYRWGTPITSNRTSSSHKWVTISWYLVTIRIACMKLWLRLRETELLSMKSSKNWDMRLIEKLEIHSKTSTSEKAS